MTISGRVLVVAGSDSSGGAGIEADIKAITMMGAYAATAITAVTAQDTYGVHAIHEMPGLFLARQIGLVLDDIGADAIKTGMLVNEANIIALSRLLAARDLRIPLVIDPVMLATSGTPLLPAGAVGALIKLLMPLAALITPNLPEAETLSGIPIGSLEEMVEAARILRGLGAPAVLIKGGHLEGMVVHDVLLHYLEIEVFSSPRIDTPHTHGTGCTLASAVAAGIAQKMTVRDAVDRARRYVQAAITSAPGFGGGHGPLDHTADWRSISP